MDPWDDTRLPMEKRLGYAVEMLRAVQQRTVSQEHLIAMLERRNESTRLALATESTRRHVMETEIGQHMQTIRDLKRELRAAREDAPALSDGVIRVLHSG